MPYLFKRSVSIVSGICLIFWINFKLKKNDIFDFLKFSAIFEILPAGQVGHVFIRSVENKLYIAFNKKGRLYGEVNLIY